MSATRRPTYRATSARAWHASTADRCRAPPIRSTSEALMTIDLPTIWAGIISLGVFLYLLLDGFDLGIGLLFPFFNREGEREVMLNTVAPVWDGNETWLVFGGACLYGVFPVAYSTLLPAVYLPVIAMLCGLIFRGVAFEIRARRGARKNFGIFLSSWDRERRRFARA